MDTPPILVLGATGSAGRRVAAHLRALGAPVRSASRHSATRFDWNDRSTWEPALQGVDRMFLMAPDGIPVDPDLVRLAAELKVGHIVLLSSRGIETMGDQRLLEAEDAVKRSAVAWTILRSDWFDQNFDEGPFREAVLAGELAVPLGDCRQGFVDLDDVGAVAARTLTEDGHTGRSYELTGPQALSFAEVCAVIEDVAGHPMRFHGSEDAYRAAQTSFGRSEQSIERDIVSYAALRALGGTEPLDTVPRLIGRPARSFRQYVTTAVSDGSWPRPPDTAGTS
ncbi:SDR family NAD(P)-dependent oxidoreductase [Streptomyces barringtoniae]|uniref:SDR family NAD(P)-dependent oxidoreductase n=1 Tax=Streptomyces barringtoniae TaxID=2892029 RepID=UPI001E5927E1|nr:SDR family NAD(P)-dependent oxidoreductase [Streptomyces barringtoniae]MCC5477861.1 SDR family NAD(P)-dependent oxidoreductase [Streptomyces barringtoniae]